MFRGFRLLLHMRSETHLCSFYWIMCFITLFSTFCEDYFLDLEVIIVYCLKMEFVGVLDLGL